MIRGRRMVLFNEKVLDEELRRISSAVHEKVASIPERQFMAASDTELVDHIYAQLELDPITIYEDQIEMDRSESAVDVRHDKMRNIYDRSRPFTVPGISVTSSSE